MLFVGEKGRFCARIPHLYGVIPATRGNVLTVGRPRHRIYVIVVSCISQQNSSYRVGTNLTGRLYAKDEQQRENKGSNEGSRKRALESVAQRASSRFASDR